MKFDKIKYLERIGLKPEEVIQCGPDTLKKLHYNHLLNIPFENLDIHNNTRIILDTDKLYEKIVINKRGGFCYELNGLFYVLLKELGYNVKMISARVINNKEKTVGQEFDHMALIVKIDDNKYLCDVGFGSNTAEPLKLELNVIQKDREGEFIIERYDDDYLIVKKQDEKNYLKLYLFTEISRELIEYQEMCEYHQTSPESSFTRKKLCSQLTERGMKTITDNRMIITENGIRTETDIREDEFNSKLRELFNIVLD